MPRPLVVITTGAHEFFGQRPGCPMPRRRHHYTHENDWGLSSQSRSRSPPPAMRRTSFGGRARRTGFSGTTRCFRRSQHDVDRQLDMQYVAAAGRCRRRQRRASRPGPDPGRLTVQLKDATPHHQRLLVRAARAASLTRPHATMGADRRDHQHGHGIAIACPIAVAILVMPGPVMMKHTPVCRWRA